MYGMDNMLNLKVDLMFVVIRPKKQEMHTSLPVKPCGDGCSVNSKYKTLK